MTAGHEVAPPRRVTEPTCSIDKVAKNIGTSRSTVERVLERGKLGITTDSDPGE
ncbi:MAG: hypothetical protein QOH70_683 [Blastocatellia bacterium]|jgi:IS30 family transposase|nr:hypothetical protein [Blastocatellia bacterium]